MSTIVRSSNGVPPSLVPLSLAPHGHCAIKLGAADSSAKTRGNRFERFRIEGNRIYRSPKAAIHEQFNAYIFFNTWSGEDRLNHTVIRGNQLFADGSTKPLVLLQRQDQSVGLIVGENPTRAYGEPPSIEEVTK